MNTISLELLNELNFREACDIKRADIPEAFVDTAETLWELTQYGLEHNCKGHTYVIREAGRCVGLILLGEAIPWETDPPEMRACPFYRLMGFVLDRSVRGRGVGGWVLEEVIRLIAEEYGPRPIALGVHRENVAAARFYQRHGFRPVDAMEGNDVYFLRYP